MRLLLAITEMAVAGAEGVVCELAAAATAAGDQVAVAAAPGPLDGRLQELEVSRLPLPPPRAALMRTVRTVPALRSALRGFRPDLVHAHNPRVTAAAALARRLAGSPRPPLLSTYHGVPPERVRAAARVLRGAERVACVSNSLRDDLTAAGVPSERLVLIPNGVPPAPPLAPERRRELDRELGLGDGPVVTTVGRLVPQKAHSRFIEAAALAEGEQADARFLIVGEGGLRPALERQAHALGLDGRLRFTGLRRDARDLIARSDLLVFSSDWEGLPLVALEALAAGVPLISTAVAGVDELQEAGAAEIAAREPEALAGRILELLNDPRRRRRMGELGRRLHERRFSVERMIEDYRSVYAELIRSAE